MISIHSTTPAIPSNDYLKTIIKQLQQGHVIAYPTEAVWGLGCDMRRQDAFNKILELKQRSIEKGVILLSDSIERVEDFLLPLDKTIQQIIQSWQSSNQRATTWLLPIHPDIPFWIYGNHDRVAIRVSQHTLCKRLCQELNGFLVSTSANLAGCPPAKTATEVLNYFKDDCNKGNITLIDGELGQNQQPSRIIDAITGKIIRA